LLIAHLLWDKDWIERLSQMDNPKLEHIVIQSAAAAMKNIRDDAYSRRKHVQKTFPDRLAAFVEQFKVNQKVELDEFFPPNEVSWKQLEAEDRCFEPPNLLLARAFLTMSAMHQFDPNRLLQANSLHAVESCIDAPSTDTNTSALFYLNNVRVQRRRSFLPMEFCDPLHLLVSLCRRIRSMPSVDCLNRADFSALEMACCFRDEPEWQPYFQQAQELNDEDVGFVISRVLPTFVWKRASGDCASVPEATDTPCPNDESQDYIHPACADLTGKLKRCFSCGKIESRKGELKACIRCEVALYCGRDCQRADWKKHKKECKKA
jgi:MYND finger